FSTTGTVSIDIVDFGPVDPPAGSRPAEPPARPPDAAESEQQAPRPSVIRTEPPRPVVQAFEYLRDAPQVDLQGARLPSLISALTDSPPPPPPVATRVHPKPADPYAAEIDLSQLLDALERVHRAMSPAPTATYWFADLRSFGLMMAVGSISWVL